jgi:hypothetical protein
MPHYVGTVAAIARNQEVYRARENAFFEYRDLKAAIKALILAAVPAEYISELGNADFGLAAVPPEQLLQHLITNFGEVVHQDLLDNLERIKAPWDPDRAIETVFTNGTFCRQFAQEGGDPISDRAYVGFLVTIFEQAGVLDEAMVKWHQKPFAEQTLATCTSHFKEANKFRLTQAAKASKKLLEANVATINQPPANNTTRPNQGPPPPESGTSAVTGDGLAGFDYCHSHGVCTHSGRNCRTKKDGHKDEATLSNRMGGSLFVTLPGARRPRNRQQGRDNVTPPTK